MYSNSLHSFDTKKRYVPLLRWNFLHFLYNPLIRLSGLGERFKQKITVRAQTLNPPGRIVDIGCGTGMHLKILRKTYPQAEIIGIDPDYVHIEELRVTLNTASPNPITLISAYADALPLKENSVDLCFSTMTFHHLSIEDKRAAFSEIYRTLKPGGLFMLTDWGILWTKKFRWLLIFEKQKYLDAHVNGHISSLATEAGFVIKSTLKVKPTGIWSWSLQKPL